MCLRVFRVSELSAATVPWWVFRLWVVVWGLRVGSWGLGCRV
jgi:hypothetical protein